jgi:uncharacterized Zn finger protein
VIAWPPATYLVREDDACPTCGERNPDQLVWIEDERVECQRCGTIYIPGGADDDL